MTTVFGDLENEFYNAFYIPDMKQRIAALTEWKRAATPLIHILSTIFNFYNLGKRLNRLQKFGCMCIHLSNRLMFLINSKATPISLTPTFMTFFGIDLCSVM